jgi:hypothetical protein
MLLYFNEPETGKRIPGIVVGLNSDAAKERCLTDGWTKFQRWAKSNPPDYTKEYWIRPEDAKKGNVILFSTDGLFEVPRAWVSGCFPDDGQGALRSAILKSFSELCFARVQNVNPDTDSTERMAMIANLISLDSGYSVGMFETLSVYRLENGQYVVDELDNDKEKLLDDPLLAAREFEKMRGQRQLGFEFEKG